MSTTGAYAWVADIYDAYVTATFDIPFFVEESARVSGAVLELMCGTGRVSLPLVEAGVQLTAVDLSGAMLAKLRGKLSAKGLAADVVEADVSVLALPRRDYTLALLPFHAFAELPTPEVQRATLARVYEHLAPGGRFICTLHNPSVRLRTVDGLTRLLGTFPLPGCDKTLLLWSTQQREPDGAMVRAAQIYELYDNEGRLEEKRWLDVRFRLVEVGEFRSMAEGAGFSVERLYGEYDRAPFDPEMSPVTVWTLSK
jgi:SAM-dependent methyltransferase